MEAFVQWRTTSKPWSVGSDKLGEEVGKKKKRNADCERSITLYCCGDKNYALVATWYQPIYLSFCTCNGTDFIMVRTFGVKLGFYLSRKLNLFLIIFAKHMSQRSPSRRQQQMTQATWYQKMMVLMSCLCHEGQRKQPSSWARVCSPDLTAAGIDHCKLQ